MVAHIKAVVYGTLFSRQSWSVGINLAGPDNVPVADPSLNTLAQQFYADFLSAGWNAAAAPATALKALTGSTTTVNGVRLYVYTGNNTTAITVGQSSGAAQLGTGGGAILPPQCAAVFTLRTGFAGRAKQGRIYFPLGIGSMQADGTINSLGLGPCTAWANVLSLWATRSYQTVNTTPSVLSRGALNSITRVTLDNVVDTQRRRRDKILATAVQSAPLVVG